MKKLKDIAYLISNNTNDAYIITKTIYNLNISNDYNGYNVIFNNYSKIDKIFFGKTIDDLYNSIQDHFIKIQMENIRESIKYIEEFLYCAYNEIFTIEITPTNKSFKYSYTICWNYDENDLGPLNSLSGYLTYDIFSFEKYFDFNIILKAVEKNYGKQIKHK